MDEFLTIYPQVRNSAMIHIPRTACAQACVQADFYCEQGKQGLFADAETAENDAEQVVGGEFAGDFTQRMLG